MRYVVQLYWYQGGAWRERVLSHHTTMAAARYALDVYSEGIQLNQSLRIREDTSAHRYPSIQSLLDPAIEEILS